MPAKPPVTWAGERQTKMSNEMIPAAAPAMTPQLNPQNAAAAVAMTREMAETLASVQMAKTYPRDVIAARDRILNACTRPKLAQEACYTYTKGGTDVTGPSIRLAEMLAQNWGNMTFGIRELEQRNGESTCEAFAWDMETNARQVKVFQVPHIRHTRSGDYPLTDPREIYELIANNGARRLRACILGIIPGDIVEEAVEACDKTTATKCPVTKERLAEMLEKFAKYGVTKEQIEVRVQCHLDAIKPAQLANLGKIYNSIKDGMSKPEDWFPPEEEARKEDEPKKTPPKKLRDALKVPTPKKDGDAQEDAQNPADEEDIPY